MSFSGRATFRIYIPVHVLVMQQQYKYVYQLVLIIILDVSIRQYNPENTAWVLSIFIFYFWLHSMGGRTSLRFIPPVLSFLVSY